MNKKNVYNFVKRFFPLELDYSGGRDPIRIRYLPDKSMRGTASAGYTINSNGKYSRVEVRINRTHFHSCPLIKKRIILLHEIAHAVCWHSGFSTAHGEYEATKWALIRYKKIFYKLSKNTYKLFTKSVYNNWILGTDDNPHKIAAERLHKEGFI